jgi:phenylalanyl-tRNA synthetase beta chain
MPTITCNTDDLYSLIGKKLDEKKLLELLDIAKAELESPYGKEITIKYNDTNQPYLWSVEGLARLFRCYLGINKKLPELNLKKGKDKVIYDRKLSSIRPYIACFTATGKKIDEKLLKQLIQLQEKLAESFGKKRQKISIGIYPLRGITFPLQCKAVNPTEEFTPLDFHEPITLKQTLEKHPKGKEYGHILEGSKVYPVFVDANKNILSLIPIINSEQTGRVKVGDDAILFDTTGTDENAVNLVANIFAYALSDRGFEIQSLTIEYPAKKVQTPTNKPNTIKVKEEEIGKILGVNLKTSEIQQFTSKMGLEYKSGTFTIPPYRADIMHSVDVMEDVAIAYGYNNFEALPLTSYTIGAALPEQNAIDSWRTFFVGLEHQEVMSAVLSNKELLYEKMNSKDKGTIEILNPVSSTYNCVRTWILPILLDFLSKNKHYDYPQKAFEQGIVSVRNKNTITDEQHISSVSSHSGATFTEIKQAIEFCIRNSGLVAQFEELEHPSFISGRAARIMVNKKEIGICGEIHPAVLEKFGIQMPTVGCEINLNNLF